MTVREQLDSFYKYALAQIELEGGESKLTLEELISTWYLRLKQNHSSGE